MKALNDLPSARGEHHYLRISSFGKEESQIYGDKYLFLAKLNDGEDENESSHWTLIDGEYFCKRCEQSFASFSAAKHHQANIHVSMLTIKCNVCFCFISLASIL